jgi:hypothetical protein
VQLQVVAGCVHPETGDPTAFWFSDRYWDIRRRGPSSVLADVLTIQEVIKSPARRFRGLKRPGKDEAFALVGRPKKRWDINDDGEPVEVPLEGNTLFVVYLDEDLRIFNHAWIELDHYSPGRSAADAENDFVKKCFESEIDL